MTLRAASAALVTAGLLFVPACSDDASEAPDPAVIPPSGPSTVEGDGVTVRVDPGPHSVLTAVITVSADHPVRPRLTARAEDHEVSVPPPRRARQSVTLPLVGLRANTEYEIELGGDPALAELAVDFRTGSLPSDLPLVHTEVAGTPRPGVTLFNATPSALSIVHPGNLLAVDDEGEVVWYHQDEQLISDVRQLPNGHLLFNFGNIGAREIDVLGNVVHDWTTDTRVRVGPTDRFGHETYVPGATVVATPRLHHEVAVPLPNGNFLALSQEIRTFRGFDDPGCPPGPFADPTVRPQRGDVVVEYTPDGEIVHQISLLDAIDPRRQPGSQQCNLKTDEVASGPEVFVDWSHANSATLFEDDNVVLVSARNLSSILALRWRSDATGPAGEVLWQFGPDLDFELTDGEWFYRQHAPEVQPDGTILVYDNGSQRPSGDDGKAGPPFSRAVQYELDQSGPPGSWTARQVWEHRLDTPDGPVYADFLGDADALAAGHVLITHGAIVDRETQLNEALLVEVDRATDDVVLRIEVEHGDGLGWQTYRAEHLDTWYPAPGAIDLAGDPPLP